MRRFLKPRHISLRNAMGVGPTYAHAHALSIDSLTDSDEGNTPLVAVDITESKTMRCATYFVIIVLLYVRRYVLQLLKRVCIPGE